jgi:hypothetical protein
VVGFIGGGNRNTHIKPPTWLYKWFNFMTWLLGVPFSKLYLILPHLASVIVAITVNIFCFANGQNFLHFLSQTGS